jgi:hypothetical protein
MTLPNLRTHGVGAKGLVKKEGKVDSVRPKRISVPNDLKLGNLTKKS